MKRSCKWSGCPELVDVEAEGSRYCDNHRDRASTIAAQYNGQRQAQYDATQRDKEARRFYGSKSWKRISKEVRSASPICCACKKEFASEADHVIPRKVDPTKELDISNVQALCKRCHTLKSLQERRSQKKQ